MSRLAAPSRLCARGLPICALVIASMGLVACEHLPETRGEHDPSRFEAAAKAHRAGNYSQAYDLLKPGTSDKPRDEALWRNAPPRDAAPDRGRGGRDDVRERLERADAAYHEGEYVQAYELLLPLAREGVADAQYAVGYMQYYGLGTRHTPRQALQWIERAADQGHRGARQARQRLATPEHGTRETPGGSLATSADRRP